MTEPKTPAERFLLAKEKALDELQKACEQDDQFVDDVQQYGFCEAIRRRGIAAPDSEDVEEYGDDVIFSGIDFVVSK